MKWAALVAWLLTAGLGSVLFGIWFVRGGVAQQGRAGRRRIRPQLLFTHLGLAVAGLIVWIVYLVTARDELAWAALGALGVVAALGARMLAVWFGERREAVAGSTGAQRPAESHFPSPLVAGHGLLAVVTVVLVALAAAGVAE
jgi:uncharacterized membrane protein